MRLLYKKLPNKPFSARNSYASGGDNYGFKGSTVYATIERRFIKVPGTNANNFGTITQARTEGTALCSQTRGGRFLTAGGGSGGGAYYDTIEAMETKTGGASTAFGTLSAARSGLGGAANKTFGLFIGGFSGGGTYYSSIDKVTIKINANSTSFGDLAVAKAWNPSSANSGNMFSAFGNDNANQPLDAIDTKSFKDSGTCKRFSTLSTSPTTTAWGAFACNEQLGLRLGGATNGLAATDIIEWITLKTISLTLSPGVLSPAKFFTCASASQQRALLIKGASSVFTATNNTNYTDFKSRANASQFGTLALVKKSMGGYGGS